MTEGTILKGIGGFYYVRCDKGVIYETHACGRLRREGITPLVGDRVRLTAENDSINEVLPRRCAFVRPPVANIDQMIVVLAVLSPKADLRLIDTMLLYSESKSVDAAVCINKSDLDDAEECARIKSIYDRAGYKTIITSAKEGVGERELVSLLKGKISALTGNSGVGKSSLLNYIEQNFSLETGEISKKTERGKHTTRHVELMPLSVGGYVLDTPGFGKIEIPKMAKEEIAAHFPDFAPYKDKCRYSDCAHTAENGCAVVQAVEEGKVSQSRFESYLTFFQELKDYKQWK